jgi:hypothetical protein
MQSKFSSLSDMEKKLLVANVIHNINYSDKRLMLIQTLLEMWNETPTRHASFFINQNNLNYGTANN